MADAAGPAKHHASGSRNALTPPSSASKASHIRFPLEYDLSTVDGLRKSSVSQQMASLGLGRPSMARRATSKSSTQGEQTSTKLQAPADVRPRVKSAEAPLSSPGTSRTKFGPDFVANPSRRATPPAHRFISKRVRARGGLADAEGEEDTSYTSKTFSDEYDLANEDPRILEDVQRAIRMKSRREARTKQSQTNYPVTRKVASTSDIASRSSHSPRSSIKRLAVPAPITPVPVNTFEPEIDFSPSVGTAPLHPVPSSTNGGATLDWTITTSDDEKAEKRWRTLSIMRKPREKAGMSSNKEMVEKQDTLYSDKLANIKTKIQPVTFRKAAITKDQLERQYGALLGSTHAGPSNILHVVRWYASQDDVMKASLEKAEPLTWLKHLLDKSRHKPPVRLPWHVTALIMEEYLKIKHRPDAMETIPENGVVNSLALRPSPGSFVYPGDKSPSSGTWSWTPPKPSLEPSLSRKRVSHVGQISFEPVVDSGRESIGDESKFSDNPISNWIHSRAGGTASPRNSTQSSLSYVNWVQGASPDNSRLNLKDLAQRIRRRPYGGSEDGLSSARNSISEPSQDEDRPTSRKRARVSRPRNSSLQILASRSAPPTDDEKVSRNPSESLVAHSDGEVPSTAKPIVSTQASPAAQKLSPNENVSLQPRAAPPRYARKRASLPSSNQFFIKQSEQRRHEADEERERQEYERKVQMLEDTIAQNHATRQVLQRISHHMKEYSNVQASLSQELGVTELQLPPDVLDAFNHDPSAVVGRTKRHKGWKAVEDIHERIVRQRQTISSFVTSTSNTVASSPTRSVFEDPITVLMASLNNLDVRRQTVAAEVETVSEALQRVKGVHSSVKREYNETLSHTSLIYPELSQIITLEENYRNHYQQLWNIGLDALTLLLDTVTPFWRNYGKVIGEDTQDFLIIPWYRNEFTGEPNWYPIKHLPKRSFRHWVGLIFFLIALITMTSLQLRAALSSTCIFSLPWLADIGIRWLVFPFFVIALIIQWLAVLFESLLLLTQTGVFIWWMGWSIHIFA